MNPNNEFLNEYHENAIEILYQKQQTKQRVKILRAIAIRDSVNGSFHRNGKKRPKPRQNDSQTSLF